MPSNTLKPLLDDKQVTQLFAEKLYDEYPRSDIEIDFEEVPA